MNYSPPQNPDPNFWNVWIERESSQESTKEQGYEEAWWLRVTTKEPCCEYYFGPFSQRCDVAIRRGGFIKDLYDEGATQIETEILWYRPTELTIEK